MAGDVITAIPSELARRLKPRVADALLAEQNMRIENEGMLHSGFFFCWLVLRTENDPLFIVHFS
jgi:hypothetical protein